MVVVVIIIIVKSTTVIENIQIINIYKMSGYASNSILILIRKENIF